jgi:hypothetical protein
MRISMRRRLRCGGSRGVQVRQKDFFFEKKKQKTFALLGIWPMLTWAANAE